MAFLDTGIIVLRVLISDLDSPPTYSDARLEQTLIISAQFVQEDMNIDTYTIDISGEAINPDPTETSTKDDTFFNLVVLRAACFVDYSTFRTKAAAEGVRATLGPSNISISGNLKGYQVLLEAAGSPCKLYEAMLKDYLFGSGVSVRAILSPFASPNFEPGYNYSSHVKGRIE